MTTSTSTIVERVLDTLTTVTTTASMRVLAAIDDPVGLIATIGTNPDAGAVHERIRRRGPLARSLTGDYVASSHDLCRRLLRDPRVGVRHADGSSGQSGGRFTNDTTMTDSFLDLDDPQHARLRRYAAPAFRPVIIRRYAPKIEALVHRLIDDAERRNGFDLIADIAAPLPIAVISDLLAIPEVHRIRFAEIGNVVGKALDGVTSRSQAQNLMQAERELAALFDQLSTERRKNPGDDVISTLVAARETEGITQQDLLATCELLLIAGFETTVNLIGNAIAVMLDAGEPWQQLVADPGLAEQAVEETLRFEPPVQFTSRITHEPIEVDGRRLPAGATIILDLAAANRDPKVFDEPTRFRLDRTGDVEHLAFSSGIHYCLGSGLARLEGAVALRALSQRTPTLQTIGKGVPRGASTIRGYASLPMTIR